MLNKILLKCGIFFVLSLLSNLTGMAYSENIKTAGDLLDAYENGQYKSISTTGEYFMVSPDGNFVYAHGDGLYDINSETSDHRFYNSVISPNWDYIAQPGEGIFELPSMSRLLEVSSTARVSFSHDSKYVAIGEIRFSPDGTLIAASSGIFNVLNGEMLLETDAMTSFSPNSAYVWSSSDGLISLESGERISNAPSPTIPSYSPSVNYVVIEGDGMYSLPNGELLYSLSHVVPAYGNPPIFDADGRYMYIHRDGIYSVQSGEKLLDARGASFSPTEPYVVVGKQGVYNLNDMQQMFSIEGSESGDSIFSPQGNYVSIRYDSIYQLTDGDVVIPSGGLAVFSNSEAYAAISNDGVYDLQNRRKIFDIDETPVGFSEDEEIITTQTLTQVTTYRVQDGEAFRGLNILSVPARIGTFHQNILVFE